MHLVAWHLLPTLTAVAANRYWQNDVVVLVLLLVYFPSTPNRDTITYHCKNPSVSLEGSHFHHGSGTKTAARDGKHDICFDFGMPVNSGRRINVGRGSRSVRVLLQGGLTVPRDSQHEWEIVYGTNTLVGINRSDQRSRQRPDSK